MNEKSIDSSADIALILILPIALLVMFLYATWQFWLAGIGLNIGFNFWKRYQWQKLCQKVNPVFHQLIKENRGSITALDLAMKTNFSATTAKRYLETKAAEFGAQYQDYKDRDRVYYFMTASTLGKILDDSEPASVQSHAQVVPLLSENENQSLQLEALHQPKPTEIQAPFAIADPTLTAVEPSADEYIQFGSELLQSIDQKKEVSPPSAQNQLLPQADVNPTSIQDQEPDHVIKTFPEQAQLVDHIQSEPKLLLQAELAKRFDVHSSTVYKRRDEPDFAEWSRSKDPEGIAWQYLPDTKQFCPLETQLQ